MAFLNDDGTRKRAWFTLNAADAALFNGRLIRHSAKAGDAVPAELTGEHDDGSFDVEAHHGAVEIRFSRVAADRLQER